VSCTDVGFPKLVFTISPAFAIALGTFRENKGRTWYGAINIAMMRYLFCQKWDIYTLRSFIGATTTQVYQAWASQEKLEPMTDFLPENAKLHWIGPRQEGSQGRVLYFHGKPWLVSVLRPAHLLICSKNDFFRGRLLLTATTRIFPILTRSPESCIYFLGQFQCRFSGTR
jgi:hypothetical protein